MSRRAGQLSPYLSSAVADGGVGLVTSAGRGRSNVMTVSFFAESSHVPVLVRVAIAPTSFTYELVSASGWFGLSVLCQGQESLALACGSVSGREIPKLERFGIAVRPGSHGVPLLENSLTTSECQVVSALPLDDHVVFVGEVKHSFTQSRLSYRDPLLVSDLRAHVRQWKDPAFDADSKSHRLAHPRPERRRVPDRRRYPRDGSLPARHGLSGRA